MTKKKCLIDRPKICYIFLKSRGFRDVRYDILTVTSKLFVLQPDHNNNENQDNDKQENDNQENDNQDNDNHDNNNNEHNDNQDNGNQHNDYKHNDNEHNANDNDEKKDDYNKGKKVRFTDLKHTHTHTHTHTSFYSGIVICNFFREKALKFNFAALSQICILVLLCLLLIFISLQQKKR